jgi:hypothetical protein
MHRREALYGLICLAGSRRILRGADPTQRLDLGGASLEVYISPDNFVPGNSALLDWVRRSARAVMAYFARFPVERARLYITVTERGRVSRGVTYGEDGAHITISVGRNATLDDLYKDWELIHEMVHLGFPSVSRSHHWIEEGIATYVEPIARASIGILTAEEVWGDMRRDMPQGLPHAGDQGLDRTHTWGRTYWGGALFCLSADVEIRRRTGNAKGLQDALQAINHAGGTVESEWPLERALRIGDEATQGRTLTELYRKMAMQPFAVDLDQLWEQLGVGEKGGRSVLDDRAPWASTREAICGAASKARVEKHD